MLTVLAQHPAPPARAFDIADGFAITLILMLFIVLGGVALIARCFRRREKEAQKKAHDQHEGEDSSLFRSRQARSSGSEREPWERDPDWWRRED